MDNNFFKDFPLLQKPYNGKRLVYLDSAATTQKPRQVIEAIASSYECFNANIHRAVYRLAEDATEAYERVREHVARWFGVAHDEVIFTRGTTQSINMVAATWGCEIKAGDEIVVSALEHHSNLLPWQRLCNERGALLKVIPLCADGTLDMQAAQQLITPKTKLIAVAHVSNMLGTHVDVATLAAWGHRVGAKILVDAAQSAPHQRINIPELGCDFFVCSAHKMLGPWGVGVLIIKRELGNALPPYELGGGMVYEADYDRATWRSMPHRFEAGSPAVAEVVAFGAALSYLERINFSELVQYEASLCTRVIEELASYDRIKILGPLDQLTTKGHLVSFIVEGMHAHDVAAYLDAQGICVRAGHHCAQPLARALGLEAAVRVSFYCYTTQADVEQFLEVMGKLLRAGF